MKRLFVLFVSVLANCCISFATAVTKTVVLCYKQSEFSFTHDASGNLQIKPQSGIYSYDENTGSPGLPYFSVAVYVPDDQFYQACNPTFSKSLLYDNCILAQAPVPQPTSCILAVDAPRNVHYSNAIYPQDNVRFTGEASIGTSKILYFTVCPFIYDNSDKKLYFVENIKLDITLQKSSNITKPSAGLPTGPGLAAQLMHLVINPDDYMSIADSVFAADNLVNKLDYVIITNSNLADSFLPLRNWKRQKGVWTEIMTVEDIAQIYDGASLQEKIKKCLYDLYKKRRLSYVLLGGDDTVVPVRYCRCKVGDLTEEKMPTDMYYSCFGDAFNWDANGNGVYGETDDSVGLLSSVYLSRLPIRTADDVRVYTNRLLSYEKMVNPDSWNKKMLCCGYSLADSIKGTQSDAEMMGNKLYNEAISKYWNGERKKLCDTHNDFGYKRVYNKAIQEQLSTGYAFADFITHGAPWCYYLKSDGYYDTNDATEQTNTGYTMITTTSCSTNAFDGNDNGGDYRDPCLSESLIRNENSGIIAYLGCSREGWYYVGSTDGVSLRYEISFYKNLFNSKFTNKNFSKIVSFSKSEFIGSCQGNWSERWVQFGLNPVGDAEMPLFTDSPQKLPNVKVEIDNGTLSVKTGIDSCTICVMSRLDNGRSYYKVFHNAKDVCFTNIVDSMSLCVTKQNYIPQVINDVQTYNMWTHPIGGTVIGGTIIGVGKVGSDDDFVIKYHVAKPDSEAKIVVSPYDGSPSKSISVSADSEILKLSSQQFRKGVLGISLIVNSKLASSVNYNNE